MKKQVMQIACCSLLLFSARSASSQPMLYGPFEPASGHYDLLPKADFETDISGWSLVEFRPGLGEISTSSSYALAGTHSLQLTALQTFTGPGFALAGPQVTLNAGVTYVLSGFILTPQIPSSGATIYFDLNDSPGENWGNGQTRWYGSGGIPAGGSQEWQFVSASYTPSQTMSIIPRVCVEVGDNTGSAYVNAGETFYVDNMALTEASQFAPPVQSVPEPSA